MPRAHLHDVRMIVLTYTSMHSYSGRNGIEAFRRRRSALDLCVHTGSVSASLVYTQSPIHNDSTMPQLQLANPTRTAHGCVWGGSCWPGQSESTADLELPVYVAATCTGLEPTARLT